MNHKIIIVIGGATTLIGDPSWKNKTRPMLSQQTIEENMSKIEMQIKRFLPNATIVNNANWIKNLFVIEFIRNVTSAFSVNQLLALETFKNRLNNQQHLSFMEITYPLLQAYDFYILNRDYGCDLQIGGSDQWGNITQGVSFVQTVTENNVAGMTLPLITMSNGVKMGKSVNGAIMLDENMTSVFDFWQYWRNIDDVDVQKMMLYFTNFTNTEIIEMCKSNINDAKKKLATQVTTWVHGVEKAKEAEKKSVAIFEKKDSAEINVFTVLGKEYLFRILYKSGMCASLSEAKRLIIANAVKVNEKVVNIDFVCDKGEYIVVIGKKRSIKIICE